MSELQITQVPGGCANRADGAEAYKAFEKDK